MSYRKINYKLRPAKAVERKMLTEVFRKFSVLFPIENYQYIGFGSIYFADFSLFHKSLGISKMISIEKDERAQKRVEFNRPFSCIKVFYDSSNNILPGLDISIPSIIWLDYDGKLNSDVLNDVNTVCANSASGNVFLLSLNVQPEMLSNSSDQEEGDKEDKNSPRISLAEFRLEALQKQISRTKVPAGVTGKDLSRNGLPKIIRTIVINEIESALRVRNSLLSNDEKLSFQQIFNIKYDDGANMLTIGGIIVNNAQKLALMSIDFKAIRYCSIDENSYQIKIPNLTNKEVAHLDSELHNLFDFDAHKLRKKPKEHFILEADIINYADVYRFYPTFTESIW